MKSHDDGSFYRTREIDVLQEIAAAKRRRNAEYRSLVRKISLLAIGSFQSLVSRVPPAATSGRTAHRTAAVSE